MDIFYQFNYPIFSLIFWWKTAYLFTGRRSNRWDPDGLMMSFGEVMKGVMKHQTTRIGYKYDLHMMLRG